jgi:anti-sigma B factor antagonist
MAELQVNSRVVAGIPTIDLCGELDSYSAPRVRLLLESLVEIDGPKVLVNLTEVEYIDSAGLGVLVAALKQATDHLGTLVLVAPPPTVARVLQVTGLLKIFPVFSDEALAHAHLRAFVS